MKPVAEFKKRKRRPKVKFKIEDIDYKNVDLLKNFMNDKGKISPSRVTGLDAKIQRKIAKAIKRSRQIALLPYTKIEK
ncbi:MULTISPECIES: 30S ribosomal protein S18 [Streptobacillus]|uniref:Small ribosomal subunit protein bS18 n=1 Tax=Streptobacillus moniliformis (strain ATCC 14647 / DSM 12112 / NCTC 10651 / 9901) TaxID=519441 RepID=D1AW02_STRM9|nr:MULTISPECIES: 30S ribosomal protein S18 [Streptobacillus]ACZ01912.1 ribosomal protein S18 [Streptobacillus moniliformis DSM 12112]AVL43101.1 30S ribosomal protein S18 [Streptobacillus moniliformis]SQA12882.1 BS21 [Streptobacillus moniliformis]